MTRDQRSTAGSEHTRPGDRVGSAEPTDPSNSAGQAEQADPPESARRAESETAETGDIPETGDTSDAGETPEIDDGRYVYCVVRVDANSEADAVESLDTRGVDDEPVRLIGVRGDAVGGRDGGGDGDMNGVGREAGSNAESDEPIAAVVHDCEGVYDSADFTEIRRWLVRHQRVVDDAGDVFGTPLPFQFDTIVRGGDEAVGEWLRSEREALSSVLSALADHWEYRIEVVRTEPVDEETLAADDEQLAAVRDEIEAADSGRAYLLEKRYEDRLAALRARRREALTDDVFEHVATHVREVHELDPSPTRSVAEGAPTAAGGGDSGASGTENGDPETVCRLTALAHEDDESALGAALDEVAAEPGLEVRFTGPWPPYTFTPDFGGDGDTSDGGDGARETGGEPRETDGEPGPVDGGDPDRSG